MVKKQQYVSMASDDTKHSPYLSNLNSLSKNIHRSRSHTLTFLDALRVTSAKVVEHAGAGAGAGAATGSESSGSTTQRKNPFEVGPRPSSGRRDGEILRLYRFVEEPVRFNFGDDYGDRLFVDLQREISCCRDNYGHARLTLGAVKGAECSTHDVYELSSEADMLSSFFMDGLF